MLFNKEIDPVTVAGHLPLITEVTFGTFQYICVYHLPVDFCQVSFARVDSRRVDKHIFSVHKVERWGYVGFVGLGCTSEKFAVASSCSMSSSGS